MNDKSSYKQIIKSTGIIGGSQVITVLVGIASTKLIAVFLGPIGIGIAGIYQATLDIIRGVTGLGIGFSAVRDVAEAFGTNDHGRIARTITVLKRWVWFTGLLGVVVGVIFSHPLSRYAFGDDSYAWGIALLSLTLLIGAISGGQNALLQGMRKISSIAKVNIFGILIGFLISIPLYYFFGISGIVPALMLNSIAGLALSWWFVRPIKVEKAILTFSETFRDGLGMVKFGFFTVITGLLATGTMYLVRIFISNSGGLESVGIFLAAWKLSTMYLGTVLNAMSTDYYPRLSAVNEDNAAVNRMVNEQIEMALLVASPLIIFMISFSHLLIPLFYTGKFSDAVTILRWQFLGDFFKILSWPLSFIILAKARGGIFVISESFSNALYLLLVYVGWGFLGLQVTGIAFLVMYVCYFLLVYALSLYLSLFMYSRDNKKNILYYGVLIALAFVDVMYVHGIAVYVISAALLGLAAFRSYYQLNKVFDVLGFVKSKFGK